MAGHDVENLPGRVLGVGQVDGSRRLLGLLRFLVDTVDQLAIDAGHVDPGFEHGVGQGRSDQRVDTSRGGPRGPCRPVGQHRACLDREVGVGEFHQVVPGAEDGVVVGRALLEIAAPAGHHLGPQILGRQRHEEDGRLERVRLGKRGAG